MSVHAISADEQMTVYFGPGVWRLHGPDGNPVLEARAGLLYYHPLFGRWRDLPPGDRMSVDAVESVQVRWDGGWAVGICLVPHSLWRRLIRWEDSRAITTADEVARGLADLIDRPLRSEGGEADEEDAVSVTRIRLEEPPMPEMPPLELGAPIVEEVTPLVPEPPPVVPVLEEALPPAIYNVDDRQDVRLPLRLGGGSSLDRDNAGRLVLTLATESRPPSLAITLLGVAAVAIFVVILLLLQSGVLGSNPVLGLVGIAVGLIVLGVGGLGLLLRLNRQLEQRTVFDLKTAIITLPADDDSPLEQVPLESVHGVRIRGEVVRTRSALAYQRTVALILDTGDVPLISEMRPSPLPPDPAVMPSLSALRRQADEQAGPSLARAGAKVIAAYLRVPLADE